MGWSGGSQVGEEIWDGIRHLIRHQDRKKAANVIIDALEAMDCDTIEEAEQLCFDAERPVYCWECDELYQPGDLNADGLCKNCEE